MPLRLSPGRRRPGETKSHSNVATSGFSPRFVGSLPSEMATFSRATRATPPSLQPPSPPSGTTCRRTTRGRPRGLAVPTTRSAGPSPQSALTSMANTPRSWLGVSVRSRQLTPGPKSPDSSTPTDFSARDHQASEMPLLMGPTKGKNFQDGTITGLFLVTTDAIADPGGLQSVGRVNEKVVWEARADGAYWKWPAWWPACRGARHCWPLT